MTTTQPQLPNGEESSELSTNALGLMVNLAKIAEREVKKAEGKKAKKATKGTAEAWVNAQLINATIDYQKDTIAINNKISTLEDIMLWLRIENERQQKQFPDHKISDAVSWWKKQKEREALDDIIERVTNLPRTDDSELVKWLTIMCTEKPTKYDIAVMKHFMWQVKRKMCGLKVKFHMMPVFFGKQCGGKSSAILKMLGPVFAVTKPDTTFDIFQDQANTKAFAKYFVMQMEEMSQADKTDQELIKNRMTQEILQYRIFRTHEQNTVQNNTTFIGTSNKPLAALIWDTTGTRRFWEISVKEVFDWDAINAINPDLIWGCVSQNDKCPVEKDWETIFNIQWNTQRRKDDIECWIEAKKIIPTPLENNYQTTDSLFSSWSAYCEVSGIKTPGSINSFSRKLREIFGDKCKKDRSDKRGWNVKIGDEKQTDEDDDF